jgi:hypothetical protein
MTFIFNPAIPAANNNPSVDQPDMLGNNVATDGIIAVDHIGFNLVNGGNHIQVHLPQYTAPVIVNGSGTEGSAIYSAAGVADTAHAQCYFKTAQNASGLIASPTNSIINNQSVNVTSVIRSSTGIYDVILSSNAVTTADFAIFITTTGAVGIASVVGTYAITGIGTFTIQFRNSTNSVLVNPTSFTFQVLQI